MTSSMICHLRCDQDSCTAEWTGASFSVYETRREAGRGGWTTTGGGGKRTRLRDWCPDHQAGRGTPTSGGRVAEP